MHAKIYLGDRYVTLGSSNFSFNGLKKQTEANIRVGLEEEPKSYNDIKLIADNFFEQAEDYTKNY